MGGGRIFISYSHQDYPFVQSVSTSSNGPEDIIWLDRKVIEPGDEWRDKIHKALKKSYCLIFFASTTSVKSPEVIREVDYAIHLRKRVIPVLIEKCELPYQVSNLHYINLINRDQQEMDVFKEVINGISKKRGTKLPTDENAATIVKEVKESNSFINTVIVPHPFKWSSSVAVMFFALFNYQLFIVILGGGATKQTDVQYNPQKHLPYDPSDPYTMAKETHQASNASIFLILAAAILIGILIYFWIKRRSKQLPQPAPNKQS